MAKGVSPRGPLEESLCMGRRLGGLVMSPVFLGGWSRKICARS